ncbi:MAG TPA: phosphoserine phosphatase SerB [Alphaproteobacteria bacterium]|nr:phosphoserine phosphatase SerB [Alphaproteobacteria bacterium]
MQQVITLMAAGDGELDAARIAAVGSGLTDAGAKLGDRVWLAAGKACDLFYTGLTAEQAEAAARQAAPEAAIDLGAQPAAGRRKALLVADMESTIIAEELLDELGRLAGHGEQIKAITERAMRGEIDFAQSLRNRVKLLAGFPALMIEEVGRRITLNPGARELVQTMRRHGGTTILVSGGFDCFAARVAEACGFDSFQANHLEIEGERIAGRVREPVLDRGAKLSVLREAASRLKVPLTATAAIGDGANDLPMLQAAGLGVAFRGKPVVAAVARFRLDHCDLTGMLYLQGYRKDAFST